VPIVSSYFGIGDQVIRHGENGLLAKTNDDWYVALKSLITDANLRRRLGDNAREEAVKFYSYQAYLPLMVSLIRGEDDPVATLKQDTLDSLELSDEQSAL
jgi:glycosyltransferase involved in cell wall biosynthesis